MADTWGSRGRKLLWTEVRSPVQFKAAARGRHDGGGMWDSGAKERDKGVGKKRGRYRLYLMDGRGMLWSSNPSERGSGKAHEKGNAHSNHNRTGRKKRGKGGNAEGGNNIASYTTEPFREIIVR